MLLNHTETNVIIAAFRQAGIEVFVTERRHNKHENARMERCTFCNQRFLVINDENEDVEECEACLRKLCLDNELEYEEPGEIIVENFDSQMFLNNEEEALISNEEYMLDFVGEIEF